MEATSSNYPGVFTQDTSDGDASRAVLVSHAGAAVERNQDAQFSASRDLLMCRDIVAGTKDSEKTSLVNRYELATLIKDQEIRSLERHNHVTRELAVIRSESLSAQIGQLRAEAQDSKFNQLLALVQKLASA